MTHALLPCSQKSTTNPHPKSNEWSLHPPLLLLLRHTLISSHLHLGLPTGLLLYGFSHENSAHYLHLSCSSTCLVLLHLISLIITRSWSASLHNFLQSPVTYSSLGPNSPLITCTQNTLSSHSSLMWHTKFQSILNPMVASISWIMSNVNLYMKEILNHYCCSKNIWTSSHFQRSDALFSHRDISLQSIHKTWKHAWFSQHILLEQSPY